MLFCYLFVLVVFTTSTIPLTNGYETPPNAQYHIQTDEGPERYFRYQTLSGQYRKEKRFEDGTVVGTYAWIDDDGVLRQRDYIADNLGYRILKTKNIFVGRNVPVGDAVKAAKKAPASAGTLVGTKSRPVVTVPFKAALPSTTYNPSTIQSTTPAPISGSTANPYIEISPNAIPSTTARPFVASTENSLVEITPTSYPSTNLSPETTFYSSTPRPFSLTTPTSVQYLPTPQTPSGVQYIPSHPNYETLPPLSYNEQSQNSLDYNPYVSPIDNSFVFHNGPTYPIDKSGHTYRGQSQKRIGNGYDPQYPEYDGVSVTNDGFRYYIPRAYHEEQTLPDNKKSGSFGYIDPFGIRRVIYYNAGPDTGFQHRKNNRYVGFDATPYDPRPY